MAHLYKMFKTQQKEVGEDNNEADIQDCPLDGML